MILGMEAGDLEDPDQTQSLESGVGISEEIVVVVEVRHDAGVDEESGIRPLRRSLMKRNQLRREIGEELRGRLRRAHHVANLSGIMNLLRERTEVEADDVLLEPGFRSGDHLVVVGHGAHPSRIP